MERREERERLVAYGLCRCKSEIELIQLLIAFGSFSACSMERTSKGAPAPLDLLTARSCNVKTVGSDWIDAGSSRETRPKLSALPSGLGTLMKGSMSPTAGMYSGMNGRIFVSSSMLCGLYLCRKKRGGAKSVR